MPSRLQQIRNMPWLLGLDVRRRLAWPYIRLQFAWHGLSWGANWRIFGAPIIQRHRGSTMDLGDGLVLRSWPRSNPLAPTHPVVLSTRSADATLRLGDDCGLTGAVIVAESAVILGDRVFVGGNAQIVDTDFHPLDPDIRRDTPNAGVSRPITIGDDVFIGMNSIVLKGVTIGDGSVVGAGSVVAQDVPARSVVAGNPARVVRSV